MNEKDYFTKRLATLLLVQTKLMPKERSGLESRKGGFVHIGEILGSSDYWKNKIANIENKGSSTPTGSGV